MTAVKEKLIGAITIMSDGEAKALWEMIKKNYIIKKRIEEVPPTEEEIKIMDAYEGGDEKYQSYMTHDEVLRELGLEEENEDI